jgi:very-short-patch-repair endonuclease
MVDRGELNRVSAGVFVVRGAPMTFRARLWVAVLSTGGVLGFATAAELWGISMVRDRQVHVVLTHSARRHPPSWIRLHRVLPRGRRTTTCSDLPVTARSTSVLDYLSTRHLADAVRLADRALQRGWLTIADIDRRLRDESGRTGNRLLRELRSGLDDGAAAESERLLHRILRSGGLTGWKANYPIWVGGELVAVVDVALLDLRIAIEVDGWAYHSDVDRFRADRIRQNALVALGWTVLRFTWADLTQRPGYVLATIRRLAA